jgi:predicted N-acyltransferase
MLAARMRLTLALASQALFGRNWGCRSERPFLHMARLHAALFVWHLSRGC